MKEPLQYDHFVRPQFRIESQESTASEDNMHISKATPEELIACFGPDFWSPAGGTL